MFFIRPYFQIPLPCRNLNPNKCATLESSPTQWSGFEPRSHNLGFVVDKMAPGPIFSDYLRFPYQFSFPKLLHSHALIGASQS
jgi:hypothetical protein